VGTTPGPHEPLLHLHPLLYPGRRGHPSPGSCASCCLPRPREVWFYVYVYVIDEYRIISQAAAESHRGPPRYEQFPCNLCSILDRERGETRMPKWPSGRWCQSKFPIDPSQAWHCASACSMLCRAACSRWYCSLQWPLRTRHAAMKALTARPRRPRRHTPAQCCGQAGCPRCRAATASDSLTDGEATPVRGLAATPLHGVAQDGAATGAAAGC
jgi:hypothetical protein